MTDRWQKESEEFLSVSLMKELSLSCSEFLVHAVDVEGKMEGPQKEVITLLGEAAESGMVSTYAGGIHTFEDLETIRSCGRGLVDYTIGSAEEFEEPIDWGGGGGGGGEGSGKPTKTHASGDGQPRAEIALCIVDEAPCPWSAFGDVRRRPLSMVRR